MSKFVSNIEIDVDSSWRDFKDTCLESVDDDFTLKLCRLAFISGMMHISHINAAFTISVTEYLRFILNRNISEDLKNENEDI